MHFRYPFLIITTILIAFLCTISGCGNLTYYTQSMHGQWGVWRHTRDIQDILSDRSSSEELKRKLRTVLEIRDFASNELDLPENDSYRSYADIQRPYVVWNVFATPEFSVTPEKWCFLVAGCVNYRGYFSKSNARTFADSLKNKGLDVHVGGVTAYSTLGWFDDPVLNTIIKYPTPHLAGLIFHELAHQQVYVKGDTTFNESFATTVELEGTRRWLQKKSESSAYASYLEAKKHRQQFVNLVLRYREKLRVLYETNIDDEKKRDRKQETLRELKKEYTLLKSGWQQKSRYDAWFNQELNNAKLASFGTYYKLVPMFQQLLANANGDLPTFYKQVGILANTEKTERERRLNAIPN